MNLEYREQNSHPLNAHHSQHQATLQSFHQFILQNFNQETILIVQHRHFTLLSQQSIIDQFHRLYNINQRTLRLKNWRKSQLNILVNLTSHLAYKLKLKQIFQLSDDNWKSISQCLLERSSQSCKLKLLSYMNSRLLQNKWTNQQKQILKQIVKQPQHENWVQVSIKLFQQNTSDTKTYRSARQCKDNYINYLDPRLNKGKWTIQQDRKLIQYYDTYGLINKNLTQKMKDRSIIDMKNRINIILKKQQKRKCKQVENEIRQQNFIKVNLIVCPKNL